MNIDTILHGGRLDEIRLDRMLPRVFANEPIPESQVWRRDVTFRRPRRVLVAAESGGGKSSMCAYIYGARTDYEGRLLLNGHDARELGMEQWQALRRRHIAYLPQELSLFAELSAWDNIQLKNRLTGHATDRQVEEWLDALGISARRDYPAGRMSIGQQQRVAIIRAICQPFDFLLLDEPVSHLDARNNDIAAAIIAAEADRQKAAIISTSVGNAINLDYTQTLHL